MAAVPLRAGFSGARTFLSAAGSEGEREAVSFRAALTAPLTSVPMAATNRRWEMNGSELMLPFPGCWFRGWPQQSSADFQSAVSQGFQPASLENIPAFELSGTLPIGNRYTADWKSALR